MLGRLDSADRRASRALLARPGSLAGRRRVSALRRISQTGSYGVGWILLFAVVVTATSGWRATAIAVAGIGGTLTLNTGIKQLVRRPRPIERAIDHVPSSFSMPSAHTSMAIVGGVVMTWCVPVLWPLWWLWVLVIGWSRVALGMHYLGDVLVGALLGTLCALAIVLPLLVAWS